MKRVKKIFKITAIVIIGLPIIYFSILASTALWFNYHYQVDNFNIYPDSEITSAEILIEKVNDRVIACEIFKKDLEHNIYISSSEKKFSFFAKILGSSYPAQGFNVNYLNKIFISKSFINETQKKRKAANKIIPYSALEGDIIEIICHEIIHSFVYDKLGAEKYALIPFWKQEGYAEYAANISIKEKDSLYSFNNRVEIYLDDEFWGSNKVVKDYYEAELLVENLIENKKQSFDLLMSDSITLEYARNQLYVSERGFTSPK
jgi:hypothetical protein